MTPGRASREGLDLRPALADEKLLVALTSLRATEFASLIEAFDRLHQSQRQPRTLVGNLRRRAPMKGHRGPLATSRMKVFFVLFYWRFHPSQELLGTVFGLSQGQVSRWLRLLTPTVRAAGGCPVQSPAHRPANLMRLFIQAPGLRVLLARLPAPAVPDLRLFLP